MTDYIERNALYENIEYLENLASQMVEQTATDGDATAWKIWNVVLFERSAFKFDVANAPAADVQPVVHGRWIETEQPMGWDNVSCATCSVCGEDFVLDEWAIDDVRREMHYCMRCGAKMDLEENK